MEVARITAEQSQALEHNNGLPVRLVDDSGRETSFALINIHLLGTLAGDDFEIAETYAAQQQTLVSIWNDPQLDEYTEQDGTPVD